MICEHKETEWASAECHCGEVECSGVAAFKVCKSCGEEVAYEFPESIVTPMVEPFIQLQEALKEAGPDGVPYIKARMITQ